MQDASSRGAVQVFLERRIDDNGQDRLTFIDTVSGDETAVELIGDRYTLLSNAVLYYDPATKKMMLAQSDGSTREHPFIQPSPETHSIDWLVSPDLKNVAWTVSNGSADNLTTLTTVANIDGTNPRQVLTDGPRNGLRALPVAFNSDRTKLYMDFQPDGVGNFTPFPQYAGLFALDLTTSEWDYLPDEPGCFCGAGFGGSLFLRLKVSADLSGFDLHVYNLTGDVSQTIPAQSIRDFTQAGDIVMSPDGSRAVYALAQIRDFGKPGQSIQTVFMLVDLQLMTQTTLTDPITTFVEPLAWTEDNSAVIFTSPERDGTWKVNLGDGKLDKVADATYLGTLRS